MKKKIILVAMLSIVSSFELMAQATSANITNTAGSSDFLGTGNNFDVVFKANAVEYARLKSSLAGATAGFWGFGTNAPTRQLSVSTMSNLGTARFTQTNTNYYNSLEFQNSALSKIFTLRQAPTGAPEGAGSFGFYDNTASAYRLLINSAGNIGIGTQTPVYKLDINGADATGAIVNFNNNGYKTIFLNKSGGPGNYNNLTQTNDNGIFWSDATNTGTNGFVIAPWTNSSAGIRIAGNGNVGIGTSSPASLLSIANGASDPTNYGQGIQITNADGKRQQISFIRMWNSVLSAGFKAGTTPNTTSNIWGFGTGQAVDANFSPDFFSINLANGNVTMGSHTGTGIHSDARLSVDGKMIAKSIYVTVATSEWADYVFAKGYKLPSLNEVEVYYKNNKHLIGVPSADEMEKNGNDLGATDAILLKKIEELTIYLVEQNKRLEALEKENQELKN